MATYFKIPCPGCGKSLKVSDSLCGKSRACPYCRDTVRIPETPPTEPNELDQALLNLQIDTGPPTVASPGRSAATVAPVLKKPEQPPVIQRKRAKKSWFRSSSDSASSDVSLVLSGLIAAGISFVWFALLFPLRSTYFGARPGPFPHHLPDVLGGRDLGTEMAPAAAATRCDVVGCVADRSFSGDHD